MSGFSAEWLALREPLDLAARNRPVEERFLQLLPKERAKILDLASGAGSTVAALGRLIDRPVSWILTDYDPDLLTVAARRFGSEQETRLETLTVNLAKDLQSLPIAEVDAVSTSAFLDLVSADFLNELVATITRHQKPFLASLTYDGRTTFEPQAPFDNILLDALNTHQQTDKGFGKALGPHAAQHVIKLFKKNGYQVVEGFSDWDIGERDAAFLTEFLSGWLRVGEELDLPQGKIDAWWRARSEQIASGKLKMTVGHVDFLAYPS